MHNIALSLGIESADTPENEVNEGFIASGDESETASAAILDATQEEADAVEANNLADATLEAEEQLEEQDDTLEVAQESGQFSAVAAQLAKTNLRQTLALVAGPHLAKSLVVGMYPATESFENDSMGALSVARESLKETLKGFWQAIKAAFTKAFTKLRTWFHSTIDAAPRLRARAQRIQKRAENTKGTVKGKIKVGSASSIHVNEQLGASAITGFNSVLTHAKTVLSVKSASELEAAASKMCTAIEAIGKGNKSAGDFKAGVNEGGLSISFSGGTVSDDNKKRFGEASEVSVVGSAEVSGGKQFIRVTGKGTDVSGLKRNKNTIVKVSKKDKDFVGKEFDALTISQVDKVCETVQQACDVVIDYKKAWARFDKLEKDVVKAGDTATKDIDKDADSTTTRETKAAIRAATAIVRNAATFRNETIQLVLTSGQGMLSYCDSSLSAHSEKD